MPILLTLAAALLPGIFLDRLRLPAGMMAGAVLGACALNLLTGHAFMPADARTAAQIIAGAFIGSGVSREQAREMRGILKPGAVMVGCLLLSNLLTGLAIHLCAPLDLLTAFLCATPGGISDVPVMAADMGLDAAKVVVMQTVRYMVGISLIPALIGRLVPPRAEESLPGEALPRGRQGTALLPALVTLSAAAAFGLLGRASSLPAGTMAFSTLGSLLLKRVYPRAGVPLSLRKAAQALSGAVVGAGIGLSQLAGLRVMAVPVLLLISGNLLSTWLTGLALKRAGGFSGRESALAATPAGASEIVFISADLGVHSIRVVLLQMMRLITVVISFPTLLNWLAAWLGAGG